MNILVLGGGGREHALVWAIRQNPRCDRIHCAPGNAGIAAIAECHDLDICNGQQVVEFCSRHGINLVIIGPEAPLAAGVADRLRLADTPVFGPGRDAARLETSKAFTKAICDAAGIPTARYAVFREAELAHTYVRERGVPIVVKDDGLAAGKGVTVARTLAEARDAIDAIFQLSATSSGVSIGDSDRTAVIEDHLDGVEASLFVLADGRDVLPFGTAQDYKRAYDGDLGPNTGGMGAISPAPALTESIVARVLDEIIHPTLAELEHQQIRFQGVLYAGLMICKNGPHLLEYNVRFGDPECQALMIRLGAQALDAILACANGELQETGLNWADDYALTVVMATKGYPGSFSKGSVIRDLEDIAQSSRLQVFHAGTTPSPDGTLATGGRVLAVTAREDIASAARNSAYRAVRDIDWADGFYRTDIGRQP